MAKKTNWYYVLVLTQYGPVFVTGIGEGKVAYWDKSKAPKEFGKAYAEDLAFGLQVNGYNAFAVVNRWEISNQPFYYNKGEFEWVSKEEQDND